MASGNLLLLAIYIHDHSIRPMELYIMWKSSSNNILGCMAWHGLPPSDKETNQLTIRILIPASQDANCWLVKRKPSLQLPA